MSRHPGHVVLCRRGLSMIEKRGWGTRICVPGPLPRRSLSPTSKQRLGESSPCRQPVPHTPPHPLTMETCKKIGHEHANTHTRPPPLFSLPPTSKRRHGESSPCRQPVPHTPPHPFKMETRKKIRHQHANTQNKHPPPSPTPPP